MSKREIVEYSEELWVWILRLIITTIIVLFIFVFTWQYFNKETPTEKIELDSLKNRLLYSPNCLAYSSEGNVQPGIIDILKFDDIRLNRCFKKNNYDFELILYDLNNNKIKEIKSALQGLQLAPLCGSIKNIECSSSKEYVLINDQNQMKPAILEVVTLKNV